MSSRKTPLWRQATSYATALFYCCQLVSCGPGGLPYGGGADETSVATRTQALGDAPLAELPLPGDVIRPTSPDGSPATDPTAVAVEVTPDGAASAQVPLWVAPGRAGLQPQLALTYNSRAGNGYLGVGWQLAGLPQVSRCGKTPAQNGEWDAVQYPVAGVETGRFCLDGEQLVAVSGAYGAHGTVYRTERDTFVRVVSLEPDSAGPRAFKVYTKDGRVQTFGQSADSMVGGAGRLAWHISRVEDRSGNFLTVSYAKSLDTVWAKWIRPTRIDYTGRAGTDAPRRSVRFHYSDEGENATQPARTDAFEGFSAEQRWAVPALLRRVEMWGPSAETDGLLRAYHLDYRNPSVSGRSLLVSVKECDGTGACKKPLELDWSLGDVSYDIVRRNLVPRADPNANIPPEIVAEREFEGLPYRPQPYALAGGAGGIIFFATETTYEFKWDPVGKTFDDFPVLKGGYSSLSDDELLGTPFAADLDMGSAPMGCDGARVPQFMDFNGDGFLDKFYVTCAPGPMEVPWVAYGSAAGLTHVQIDTGTAPPALYSWADMAGDGVPDLVIGQKSGGIYLRPVIATGTTFGSAPRIELLPSGGGEPTYAGSLDGTGRISIISGSIGVSLSADGTPVRSALGLPVGAQYRLMDVDGDGLTDAVLVRGVGASLEVWVYLGTGRKFAYGDYQWVSHSAVGSIDLGACFAEPHGVVVTDLHGDRREELLFVGPKCAGPSGELAYLSLSSMTFGTLALGDYPFGGAASVQALDVNRDGLTDFVRLERDHVTLAIRKGEAPDVLKGVRTGSGLAHAFEYQSLNTPDVYTPGPLLAPPLQNARLNMQVVRRHVLSEASTPKRAWRYAYKDGRYELRGRGWLGFAEVSALDEQTGETVTTQYGNASTFDGGKLVPLAHRPTGSTSVLPLEEGAERRRETTIQYEVRTAAGMPGVYQTYATSTVTKDTEVRGGTATLLSAVETTQTLDVHGNLTASATRHLNAQADGALVAGEESSVVLALDFDATEWWTRWQVAEERWGKPGHAQRVRKSRQDFDVTTTDGTPATGLLASREVQPDAADAERTPSPETSDLFLRTTLVRDAYGQVTRVESAAADGTARVERVQYEAVENLFPVVEWNAEGHPTQFAYHRGLGVLGATRDANGVTTHLAYDGLGRLRERRLDDASRLRAQNDGAPAEASLLNVTYTWDGLGRPLTTASQAGGATSWETFDAYGRPVLRQTQGFDGAPVTQETHYDALGRVERVSRPRRGAEAAAYEVYQYDALGRVLRQTHPDGTFRRSEYAGRQETLWDEMGRQVRREVDGLGRLSAHLQVKDGGGLVRTDYGYGPWGQLETVAAPGARTTFGYDVLGRQESVSDPHSGPRQRAFNAFGEVKREVDGNGLVTTLEYDALGRLRKRSNELETATFAWDTASGAGKGRPAATTRASTDASQVVTTAYGYDALGRPSWSEQKVGTGPALRLARRYDAYSRVAQVAYPTFAGGKFFAVDYAYNAVGDMESVSGPLTTGTTTFWRALSRGADGQLTQERYGNDVVRDLRYDGQGRLRFTQAALGSVFVQRLSYDYDADGNLSSRSDQQLGLTEDFRYDSLDRLERWIVNQNCRRSEMQYTYDDSGSLLSRQVLSGAGQSVTYSYTGGSSGGPHAVKSATFGGVAASYSYDGNGNQTSGPGRPTVQYTPFNLPSRLDNGVASTYFDYDARGTRVAKRSASEDVLYLGGIYQLRVKGAQRTHVYSVPTPAGIAAEVIWDEGSGSESVRYLHADPLGSPDTVTGAGGEVVERVKYEPFGGRRHARDVAFEASPTHAGARLGFTGHEHDDELGLINMRGRMYDAALGRFLSPDPLIVWAGTRQSTNRYAYVLNNPLKYTDPSGYSPEIYVRYTPEGGGGGGGGGGSNPGTGAGVGAGIGGGIGAGIGTAIGGPVGGFVGGFVGSAIGSGIGWIAGGGLSRLFGGGSDNGGGQQAAAPPPRPAPRVDADTTGNSAPPSGAASRSQPSGGMTGTSAPSLQLAAGPYKPSAGGGDVFDWMHENMRWFENLNLQPSADFAAGFGDTLTSGFGVGSLFGLPSVTEAARDWTGAGQFVNMDSGVYASGQVGAFVWGAAFNGLGYARGYEFAFNGGRLRFAPWGNRMGHPTGRFPHYHRGKPHSSQRRAKRGESAPGQGPDRHRPWDGNKDHDRSFWDRF